MFPPGDNYMEFPTVKLDNFAGNAQSPRAITAYLTFGIQDLDRAGTDATIATQRGSVVWDADISVFSPAAQQFQVDLCADLRSGPTRGKRQVQEETSIVNPVKCFMESFRDFAIANQYGFPVVTSSNEELQSLVIEWASTDLSPTDPEYFPGATNRDKYSNLVGADEVSGAIIPRFYSIEIKLDATVVMYFTDGISLYEYWEDYLAEWRARSTDPNGPYNIGDVAFRLSDARGFHYFYLQKQIVRDAFSGIVLSLVFAWIILNFATGNILMATYSVVAILLMVCGVIAFTVTLGWKIGLIEAVVYVMVVGLSVDYCVHLSEAYLSSAAQDREGRTKDMIRLMGQSVLSGAVSTLGASAMLFLGYIQFFSKFGTIIFFVITQSLVWSLVGYAAFLDRFGPQGDDGKVGVIWQRLTGGKK